MSGHVNISNQYTSVYFLGIGGIGMSALARYFNYHGLKVGGYDKTQSALIEKLIEEGCQVHFDDLGNKIPKHFNNPDNTLIVYTPAIPKNHKELNFFKENNFKIFKRAEVLGILTRQSKGLCVAGTHGKTTTSSMLAHILDHSLWKCNAFLGGIATNFNSNLVLSESSDLTVIEADEFDRSFLHLSPFASIVTSVDADHLDIYGNEDQFVEGFRQYAMKTDVNGYLIQKEGLKLNSLSKTVTYSYDSTTADYSVQNLKWVSGFLIGDVRLKNSFWSNVKFGIPGIHNAENALACIALLNEMGMDEQSIRNGLASFVGVKRRFEYCIREEKFVYIDDYAHHPKEIKALIDSIKMLYPTMKIRGVFQPHLFSRTKDFSEGFAAELSRLDEVVLMPIYPAREEPIHGITSEWLLQQIKCDKKSLKSPAEILQYFSDLKEGVLLTIGAGDIDRIVSPLKEILSSNFES
jgi:UDP-N-acetylmuramate--alanine ligase